MNKNLNKYLKEKDVKLDVIQFFELVKLLTETEKFSLSEIYNVLSEKYDIVEFQEILKSLIKNKKFLDSDIEQHLITVLK